MNAAMDVAAIMRENAVADAVAEADIYVAYGRYQQALNLLARLPKPTPTTPPQC